MDELNSLYLYNGEGTRANEVIRAAQGIKRPILTCELPVIKFTFKEGDFTQNRQARQVLLLLKRKFHRRGAELQRFFSTDATDLTDIFPFNPSRLFAEEFVITPRLTSGWIKMFVVTASTVLND